MIRLAVKSNTTGNFWNFKSLNWEKVPTEGCLIESTFVGVKQAQNLVHSQFEIVPDVCIVSIELVTNVTYKELK